MKTLPAASDTSVPLRTDREVAEFLGISHRTVQNWRFVNQGPRFIRIGRSIRYRAEDLSAFIATMPSGGSGVWVPRNGK